MGQSVVCTYMSCQLISIIAADVWFCQEKMEICLVLDQRGCIIFKYISGKSLPNDRAYVMSYFCRLLSVLTFCWCRSTLYIFHVVRFVWSAWHLDHRAGSDMTWGNSGTTSFHYFSASVHQGTSGWMWIPSKEFFCTQSRRRAAAGHSHCVLYSCTACLDSSKDGEAEPYDTTFAVTLGSPFFYRLSFVMHN